MSAAAEQRGGGRVRPIYIASHPFLTLPHAMPEEPPNMDTLAVEEALEEAGFSEKQAAGLVRAFQMAQAHLATKDELRKMELRLRWQIPLSTATIVAAILAVYQFVA